MSTLRIFLLAVMIGFALYFSFYALFDKPLTDGEFERLYTRKLQLLNIPGNSRLFIIAGSNGRFSHSCEVIEKELNKPCENLSTAVGVGLDFIFRSFLPGLKNGDTVYMPLEYSQYIQTKEQSFSGPDNAIMLKRHRDILLSLGSERVTHALFFADEKYFINAILETLLAKIGLQRRFTDSSVNDHGDQQGHTPEAGKQYAQSIAEHVQHIPDLKAEAAPAFSSKVIHDFLLEAHQKGVRVIGGLPTIFSDSELTNENIAYLKSFYESAGQDFLVLENHSQYPRSCFFDTDDHLNSVCQAKHSLLLAKALHESYLQP